MMSHLVGCRGRRRPRRSPSRVRGLCRPGVSTRMSWALAGGRSRMTLRGWLAGVAGDRYLRNDEGVGR